MLGELFNMEFFIQKDYQDFEDDLLKLPHTQKMIAANEEISLTNQTYFIVSGRVVEILLLPDGEAHALVAYGPQTLFPPLFSASMPTKDELIFRFVQPSTLWCYDNTLLANYAEQHRTFAKQLNQSYLKHMNYYLNDISQLITSSGMQRLVTFLNYYLDEHHPSDNLIPIRQKNLARLIALNPTNMSRNIKKLKEANIVQVSGAGITVLNPEALNTYLD